MAIRELDSGQSHTFPSTALRVQLTGVSSGGGAVLRALDQAGDESVTVRLTDVEVVLTPQPRRLRLVALPSAGSSFAPGLNLGLTLRTEGVGSSEEQVLVSPVDVGALTQHEIAILEFATGRVILTVSGTAGGTAPPRPVESFTSGGVSLGAPAPPSDPSPGDPQPWLQPGRYALRDAARLGTIGRPVDAWGVVLDGSASMHRLYASGQLDRLLGLVCGTCVQWTSRWATASAVAGVRVIEVPAAATDPGALTALAFDGRELGSWSSVAVAAGRVSRRVGAHGAVLIVTDGVPGDIDRLVALVQANPTVGYLIVTTGVSALGLASDADLSWWQEELAGFAAIDALPNVRATAVRVGPDHQLELDGSRPAELASRLTAPMSMSPVSIASPA